MLNKRIRELHEEEEKSKPLDAHTVGTVLLPMEVSHLLPQHLYEMKKKTIAQQCWTWHDPNELVFNAGYSNMRAKIEEIEEMVREENKKQ